MAEIVNLRMARKQRSRANREVEAARNRAAFGRPASERKASKITASNEQNRLDAHLRDAPAKTGRDNPE
jgi:hypothetical protein